MRVSVLMVLFLLTTLNSFSQSEDVLSKCASKIDSVTKREVYIITDTMPEFPGGVDSLMKFISYNIRWPNTGEECMGKVYISFIVETDGTLSDFKILRGICENYDNEAMRVVKMLPPFSPGKCKGMAVPVNYIIPIRFQLQ